MNDAEFAHTQRRAQNLLNYHLIKARLARKLNKDARGTAFPSPGFDTRFGHVTAGKNKNLPFGAWKQECTLCKLHVSFHHEVITDVG